MSGTIQAGTLTIYTPKLLYAAVSVSAMRYLSILLLTVLERNLALCQSFKEGRIIHGEGHKAAVPGISGPTLRIYFIET